MSTARGARQAFVWGSQRIMDEQPKMLGELQQGYDTAKDAFGKADSFYEPYAGRAEQGASMYANALGLNGIGGNEAARSAFQSGPGYGFQMDQGLQALFRRRAAGGMLNSGNADADTLRFSQGLADSTWNGWQDRLAGLGSQGVGIAGARAGIQQGLAGLATDYYGRRVGLQREDTGNIIGMHTSALKATDANRNQNEAMRIGALQSGLSLLGSAMTPGGIGSSAGVGGAPGASGFTNIAKMFGG